MKVPLPKQRSVSAAASESMREYRWKHRDIPARYRSWRLKDFSEAVRKAVEPFCRDEAIWSLYLHGGIGTKKSSLAAAVLIRHREAQTPPDDCPQYGGGIFLPIYVAAEKFRRFDQMAKTNWATTKLLVVDDLGKSRETPHLQEQLLHLLHNRYDHVRKTIVTSNLSLDQLARHIDPATASRFQEGIILDLGDRDARRQR